MHFLLNVHVDAVCGNKSQNMAKHAEKNVERRAKKQKMEEVQGRWWKEKIATYLHQKKLNGVM